MCTSSEKEHFEVQYKKNAFFSPKEVQFVIYDKKIWSFAKELLRDSKTVADIGAGGGTLLYNISKITTAKLIAVDFSDIAVTYLKRMVPEATILKEDVTETSLGNESLDFVASTMTIEHVDDDKLLKEVRRILKDKGYFLITTVLKTRNAWYFYKDKNGKSVLEPSHLQEYGSLSSFLKLLNKYGFIILKAETPRLKFPLIDPLLKRVFGLFRNDFWNAIPATKPVEFLRKISMFPIPGYYAIEVIAQKKTK
ncbi:class I SAM-dependent methyltransferase [bacterium]|nr:class I SAM-dependent methyltransferase [bacterium]